MARAGVEDYDYIVVGGGTAGCPLAARLSERASVHVLLIEAGADYRPGQEPPEILDIFAATAYADARFVWSGLKAAFGPKPGNEPDRRRRVRYPAGRVIGGGSSINGMASNRGLPSDYDAWAASGAIGWDWNGVLPFFKKLETDSDFDGPLHGKDGPIRLQRYAPERWPGFTRGVMQAIADAGWSNIADQNARFDDGFFPVAYCHTSTMRMGAAWRYLTAEVRRRPNLTVMGGSRVDRLMFDGVRCTGVHVRGPDGEREITAREVIVSAGAIHSPVLLLRSGIGPAHELRAHGIGVVADRRGVGKHLMEHPGVNFGCFLKRPARLPVALRRQMLAGLRWSSGLPGCSPGDMYVIPTNKAQWHAIGHRLGIIMMWVNRSFSTGEIRLTGPDAGAPPDIDFNICSDERDIARLVKGVKLLAKLQTHPAVQETVEEVFPISFSAYAQKLATQSGWNALQTFVGAQAMDASSAVRRVVIRAMIADAPSVDDLVNDEETCRAWIRSAVLGHYHASCTCRMGRPDDPLAVTDASARVYGVEGLRVADASIMPSVPCANTNLPTIMIGEKVAAVVLNSISAPSRASENPAGRSTCGDNSLGPRLFAGRSGWRQHNKNKIWEESMRKLLEPVGRHVWLAMLTLITAIAPLHPDTAAAQADAAAVYPKAPVKMIVGLAPGGSNDIVARVVAQKLSERLGQPFVVENKPGAGGTIAAEFVANAEPDGLTLLVAPSGSMTVNPATYSKLPYDPLQSYELISNMALYQLVLSVSESLPVKSVAELVAWGKAHPDKANYASTSAVFQLTSELFNQKTGSKFQYIPFKSGAELVTAVISGQAAMTFADAGPAMPLFKAGKLRPLATTGAMRLPALPDVPTLGEIGIKGVVVEGFIGLAAPKGMPAPIVKEFETEVMAVARLPGVAARITQLGLIPDGSSGDAFRDRIARDIKKYTAVAKAAHIHFD